MNKTYLIAPLAGALVFGAVYWTYSDRRETTRLVLQEQAAIALHEQQEHARLAQAASVDAANAAAAQRKQDRLKKEQQEAERKQALSETEARREHAFEKERKLRSQIDRRHTELERANSGLQLLARQTQELAQESAALVDYLKAAEANQQSLLQLLEKLDAAERAHATATHTSAPALPPSHS